MTIYSAKVTEISKANDPNLYWQIVNEIKRFKKGDNAIYRVYNKKPQAKKCYIIPKSSLKFDEEHNTIMFPQNKLKIQIPFVFNWDDLKLLRIKQKLRTHSHKISLVFKHAINRTKTIRRAYRGYVELNREYKWRTHPTGSSANFPSVKKILASVTKRNEQGKILNVITKKPQKPKEKITNYNIEIRKLETAITNKKKRGCVLKEYLYLLTRLRTIKQRRKQLIKHEITKIATRVGHIAYKENLFLVIDKTLKPNKTKYYYFTLLEALKREFTKRNLLVIHKRNEEDISPVAKTFLCDLCKEVEYNLTGWRLSTEKIDKLLYKFWESGEKYVSDVYGFDSPEEKRIYSLMQHLQGLNIIDSDPRKGLQNNDIAYMTTHWDGITYPWAAGKGEGSGYPKNGKRFWHGSLETGKERALTQEEVDKTLSDMATLGSGGSLYT